jgi:hypothetical protein
MSSEWKSDQNPPPRLKYLNRDNSNGFVEWLYLWTADMAEWGKRVRKDILRIEEKLGIEKGDPGDPPGGPPNGD